jgi:RNA polymerase sigma-70 factor (ECF subfamily)
MENYNNYSDDELLDLIRKKSPVCDMAFQALYNRYSEQLNAYCVFKAECESDAEEIFQDTWLKFFHSVKDGNKIDIIIAFLYKIARNLSIDKYRSSKSKMFVNIDSIDIERISAPFNLHAEIEKDDLINMISMAVNSLDEIYKETFIMQWFGNLTLVEISDVLGETIGCIKMRSHRAMADVIKILKPYIIEISS